MTRRIVGDVLRLVNLLLVVVLLSWGAVLALDGQSISDRVLGGSLLVVAVGWLGVDAVERSSVRS